MNIKFTENMWLYGFYTWYCSDGCCSDVEEDGFYVEKDQIITLTNDYGNYRCEGIFPDDKQEEMDQPFFLREKQLNKLIEKGHVIVDNE